MKYKIYYFTILVLVSLFLWWAVIFILKEDAAGWIGFAAFLLDVMAVTMLTLKD